MPDAPWTAPGLSAEERARLPVCLTCEQPFLPSSRRKSPIFCSVPCQTRFKMKRYIQEIKEGCASAERAGCINWRYGLDSRGYGIINRKIGKIFVHRLAYELAFGPPDRKLFVCHRCDNPACFNPHHLFLGTHDGNVADMVAKGRHPRGETQHKAKLTEADVLAIRDVARSNQELAVSYGVSASQIARIRAGTAWKHVAGAEARHLLPARHKMTPEQVQEVRASSERTSVLADRYGVGRTTIQQIRSGAKWNTGRYMPKVERHGPQ